MPKPSQSKEDLIFECPYCEKAVNAKIEGEYSYLNDEIGEPLQHSLLSCPECNGAILTTQDYDWNRDEFGKRMLIFPLFEKELDWSVPWVIRECYAEAKKCFKARAFVAGAVMCRRTLEAIMLEHIPGKKSLATKIKEMKDKGLIDSSLLDWSETLRLSGNKAAHDVKSMVGKQDAQDILDFTHAITEYLFVYRKKFEEFKKRANKKQ